MIKTYDLTIFFVGYTRHYYNISRVAVNRFVEYHRENVDFADYDLVYHDPLVSG